MHHRRLKALLFSSHSFRLVSAKIGTEYVSAACLLCFVTQGFELDPVGWERASKYSDYAVLDHWLCVGRAEFFRNNPTRA